MRHVCIFDSSAAHNGFIYISKEIVQFCVYRHKCKLGKWLNIFCATAFNWNSSSQALFCNSPCELLKQKLIFVADNEARLKHTHELVALVVVVTMEQCANVEALVQVNRR